MASTRILLPTDVTPNKYFVHLIPNFADFTFQGNETIQVKVNTATDKVVIHAKEIQISSAVLSLGGNEFKAKDISYDEKHETATLAFESALPTGEGALTINFNGILNDQMAGFYRSKYVVNGEERYMATTQFEPTDARRAFPCWDEPAIKATFEIQLTVPKGKVALSNMPPVSETEDANQIVIKFAETPIMSTYLIAFVVGEFDFVEDTTKEGVKVRVYTPLGKRDQGKFALNVATKTLSFFTEYYGIGYPLPKMDMIAIADFAAGAMENWGLVTYRETALLVDEANSSVSSKQRIAYVVGHELAHQWFGNLVTMEWWKELWLNEGFATFVGNQPVDYLFPEWDIWTQFVSQYFARAQQLDGLKNSHPIEVEVASSAQVNEIFDLISYCKGASVIRMVATYLGEEAFRKGLNLYLNRHKYANAVTEDLWIALEESSGKPVKNFMNNWIKETGYPVVSISPGQGEGVFEVEQTHFLASGEIDENSVVWHISLGFISSNSKTPQFFDITEKKQTITVDIAKGAQWIKANAGQSGFFRVKYSEDLMKGIRSALHSQALPAVDRLGIQSDAFALAKAGLIPTHEVLSLLEAYENEKDYTIWSDISTNLDSITSVWAGEPNFHHLQKLIQKLFRPTATELGWDKKEGENDLTTLLRQVVLGKLASNGDAATVQEAQKRFEQYLKDSTTLPADLRGIVYKTVVEKGGKEGYDAVERVYRESDLHEEKIRALTSLGYATEPSLIRRVLEFSISDEVRSQDVFFVFASTCASVKGREISWNFLKEKWDTISNKFGIGALGLQARIVGLAITRFLGHEKAKEIEEYFQAHPCEAADRTIKQGLESIHSNTEWLERERVGVADWLAQKGF